MTGDRQDPTSWRWKLIVHVGPERAAFALALLLLLVLVVASRLAQV